MKGSLSRLCFFSLTLQVWTDTRDDLYVLKRPLKQTNTIMNTKVPHLRRQWSQTRVGSRGEHVSLKDELQKQRVFFICFIKRDLIYELRCKDVSRALPSAQVCEDIFSWPTFFFVSNRIFQQPQAVNRQLTKLLTVPFAKFIHLVDQPYKTATINYHF